MSTPRERGQSPQLACYPQGQAGAACHHTRHERSPQQRWIVRLDQHVNVGSHVLACAQTAWTRPAVVYRPDQADAWAWRGSTLGMGCGGAYGGMAIP